MSNAVFMHGFHITIDKDKYDKVMKKCLMMKKIHNIVVICSNVIVHLLELQEGILFKIHVFLKIIKDK